MNSRIHIFGAFAVVLVAVAIFLSWDNNDKPHRHKDAAKDATPVQTNPGKINPADPGEVSPIEEPSAGPDSVAEDNAGQRANFLEHVEPLFGSREKRRGLLYRMVVEALDKESVPFLRDLLQDDSYKDRWSEIGIMLAWLSDRDDEESVAAILDYIRRPNTWSDDNYDSILDDAVAKGSTLHNLGLFDSDIVSDPLQDAFTEEGAKELIREWVNNQSSVEPLHLIYVVRSWAAKGLVLTRDPENIAIVRENYEDLAHKMLTAEYREREMTSEMWLESEWLLAFAGGMADNDILMEMSVEEFMILRDDSEKWARITLGVSSKYVGTALDDDRTVMEQCPVCGKTSE